jgi:hypothetical protein
VVWARPHDSTTAADITRKVTLTGGEFIVAEDGRDWTSDGVSVQCLSGSCEFSAPVVFPCLPSVTVERIRLHVDDAHGSASAAAMLYRAQPTNRGDVWLGSAASHAGTFGFQTYSSQPINKRVWPSQRAYIWLSIGGPNIRVYGVTVEYHRNI